MIKKLLAIITLFTTLTVAQTPKRHYDVSNSAYYSLLDATHVDTLYDLGSDGINLTQTDTTRMGAVFSTKINGRPALWFDDGNYYGCATPTDSINTTIFIVGMFTNDGDAQDILLGAGLLEPAGYTLGLDANAPNGWRASTGGYFDGNRSDYDDKIFLLTLEEVGAAAADTLYLRQNGTRSATTITGSGTAKARWNILGGYFTGDLTAMRNFCGYVAEVRQYTGLTEAQKIAIQDTLAGKYLLKSLPYVGYPYHQHIDFWVDASNDEYAVFDGGTGVIDTVYSIARYTPLVPGGAAVPKMVYDAASFLQAIEFYGDGGLTSGLINHAGSYVPHNATWFVVFEPDAGGSVTSDIQSLVDFGTTSTSYRSVFPYIPFPATNPGGLNYGGSTVYGDSAVSLQAQIACLRQNATGTNTEIIVQYANGLVHTIKDTAINIPLNTRGGVGLGNEKGGTPDNEYVGKIKEVVLFNRAMPDDSITAMFATLYDKWFGGGLVITYPNEANLIFNADSVITITWTALSDSVFDLYYSLDNGVSWSLIVNDVDSTSYDWTIPNTYTTEGLIQLTNSDSSRAAPSDTNFVILPHSAINILSPIDTTLAIGVSGVTVNLIFETIVIDTVTFYWGQQIDGSINYEFLATVPIDTVNNAFQDTTIYEWNIPNTVFGDSFYVYGVTGTDTVLYTFSVEYLDLGDRIPTRSLCTEEISQGLIRSTWKTDFSCGWVGTITWRYWQVIIAADGSGFQSTYNACEFPHTDCTYPTSDYVYITSISDTTAISLETFYQAYGGYGTTSMNYKLRTYYIDSGVLYMNDNRNGINGIELFTLPVDPSYPTIEYNLMEVYNVRRDSVEGGYFPDTYSQADFEALNPSNFTPLILVGQDTFPYNTIIFEALDTPPDPNYAEDTELIFSGITARRDFLRGIHPKAEKRN